MIVLLYIQQDFRRTFIVLYGLVTWIISLRAVMGVMHEADDADSIWRILSCYWLDQFLRSMFI